VNRLEAVIFACLLVGLPISAGSQERPPLELLQSIPLPGLHDGDFDHFALDIQGNRLFSTAEENSQVLVFDLSTNKLTHSITGLKAPHSMLYRSDLKKLFVVDGDLGEVKMYETASYRLIGSIKLREGTDSSTYDPVSKYLYVVNGGKAAKLPNVFISILDTTTGTKVAEIEVDSISAEAMVIEKSGPRLFVAVRGNNTVEAYDRKKRTLLATWPVAQEAKNPTSMAFDEASHRLFVGTREPGKLVVLDSNSGKVVASLSSVSAVDDTAYASKQKRIYNAGSEFLDVFQERDSDHYDLIAHIPTGFRAHTGLFSPELNRYYLGVPRHEGKSAEVRIYNVLP
jgi:DNA-binding beta-propeller fold protein YncE